MLMTSSSERHIISLQIILESSRSSPLPHPPPYGTSDPPALAAFFVLRALGAVCVVPEEPGAPVAPEPTATRLQHQGWQW